MFEMPSLDTLMDIKLQVMVWRKRSKIVAPGGSEVSEASLVPRGPRSLKKEAKSQALTSLWLR